MSVHWLIAPVLLPALVAAGLLLVRPARAIERAVSIAGALALLVLTLALLVLADEGATLVYALGRWRPPFGIALVLDRLAALMLVVTAVLALAASIAMCTREDDRGPFLHPLLHFQLMGLNGAFLTGDLFNLFVFFEVLLVASYGLLLHGQTGNRLRAGLHYVVVNLVGSFLFLIAVAVLYAMTGTLNLADLAARLPLLPDTDRALAHSGALLLLVVFALKAALFPLFLWLPPAYGNASAAAAASFAVMTKLGVYAILRTAPLILVPAAPTHVEQLHSWLLATALATMLCGALAALASRRLSTMAAQLTLLSVGSIVAVASLMTVEATAAALYYLVHSTIAGATLFLVCGLVIAQRPEGGDRLLGGAMPDLPTPAVLFMLTAMAVVGLPPLSGFVGKAAMLQASVRSPQAAWVWGAILLTSLLALLALMRGGMAIFWLRPAQGHGAKSVSCAPLYAGAFILLLGLLGLSFAAAPVLRFTDATARQLDDHAGYLRAMMATGGKP